ncbi:MAG TPA: MFS transporter [Acetobacteraceae bacterium]|nr:MFS transporter [Acetobacteraceae bacterium]
MALFYGTVLGLVGTQLPFFPVWLKSIGLDASWIGLITAVPSLSRFTVLPFVTNSAERYHALRGTMILTACATAFGFAALGALGALQPPLAILIVFALTACVWTPLVPLTDGYALKGVIRYGLHYGPLRMWGSAAFVLGALVNGVLADVLAPQHLIWVIVAVAGLGALVSFGLQPLDTPKLAAGPPAGGAALLRDPGFLAILVAAALIQGSHAAYYTFASITWQASGLGGLTIAGLWVLGVCGEIVIFAISPRFTLPPALLMVIGGLCAVVRWLMTAQEPPVALLAAVQMMHGLTYGLTQVGTMELLVRRVPGHVTARAQGYLTACIGIAMSCVAILSGLIYAQYGSTVYYAMAAVALAGALVIWLARHQADPPFNRDQPQNAASGG